MSRMLRRAVPSSVALAAASVLAGCGGMLPQACPAIGWSNEVVVTSSDPRVAAVDLCDERGCASQAPGRSDISGFQEAQGGQGTWTFALPDMSTPDAVVVRTLAADGTVIGERSASLDWRRVGGSEACGGPGQARLALAP
jgi:hypothetical protein